MILEVATRLFAAMGYDATSTRQIADAVGLNVATVNYHVGGKRELYLAVMERAYQAEHAAVAAAVTEFQQLPLTEALHCLLDRYIDFCLCNPDIPALWMHRWLDDAADMTELERQYTYPLVSMVAKTVRPALESLDVDIEYTIQSMVWCINGFAKGGIPDAHGNRRTIHDPHALRRFRAHLHVMLHRTLGLPGNPPKLLASMR
ncbi:TetR/AcrR family transcriptional regulator [Streptosporangiaceae bacterium NEAU-GS5]|nr:TetR/AcrR family transcriptional regulator [Streptosporangiaceae bacterium NEAU-GS5]